MSTKPKLIFVVTEDWYFYSHRLPMVRAAQDAGFDVSVITGAGDKKHDIEAQGVRVIPFDFRRRSLNPFRAIAQIMRLSRLYREEKPALVHHIAMKPILFGSVAALRARVPCVVNAFAGLGYVFNARTVLASFIRPFLLLSFRFLLKRPGFYVLLQNPDDKALLEKYGLLDERRTAIIRGSGVDVHRYKARSLSAPVPDVICVFAGRMVGIKGLPTLKEAFEILENRYPYIRLWLCGRPDPHNPVSWGEAQLKDWQAQSKNVVYKGFCPDMGEIWQQAHIALQPSYGGEGVPKSLLEAAASARAIVATDVPGCREVVKNGVNGYLVPPYDAQALAAAVAKIAVNAARCKEMGQQSRALVVDEMSAEAVRAQTKTLYERCRRETGCG